MKMTKDSIRKMVMEHLNMKWDSLCDCIRYPYNTFQHNTIYIFMDEFDKQPISDFKAYIIKNGREKFLAKIEQTFKEITPWLLPESR